jgi:DNA-binding transcriptional ArsR family regulator
MAFLPKAASSELSGSALLREAIERRGQATVAELAEEAGLSRRAVSAALTRLIAAGQAHRLGRGLVARPVRRSRSTEVQVGPDAGRIVGALEKAGVAASLSGYDVLASFANQLPVAWPHLVVVDRGSGEWAADVLRAAAFVPILEPNRDQLALLAELRQDGLVILRERSIPADPPSVRSVEEAWVDLAAEQRAGYPIASGDLSDLLLGLADADVSWTRLVRAARRRSLPLRLDPHASPVPLAPEPNVDDAPLARLIPSR